MVQQLSEISAQSIHLKELPPQALHAGEGVLIIQNKTVCYLRKMPVEAVQKCAWYVHAPRDCFPNVFIQHIPPEHRISPHTRHIVGILLSSIVVDGHLKHYSYSYKNGLQVSTIKISW